ncbi:MAG: hypothetical protein R3Y13_02625 [bacterium]
MYNEIVEKLNIKVKGNDHFIKFLPVLIIINDSEIDNKIKILQFHKIPIRKLSQVKVLALTKEELERRITISKSNGFFIDIMKNPLSLLDVNRFSLVKKQLDTKKVISMPKVIDEEVKEVPNVISPANQSILDSSKKESIYEMIAEPKAEEVVISKKNKVIDSKTVIKCSIDVENILIKPITSLLTEESFIRYETLSVVANDVLNLIDLDLTSRNVDMENNIMKLVVNNNYNDNEILLNAFSFRADLTEHEYEKLKNIIMSLLLEKQDEKVRSA